MPDNDLAVGPLIRVTDDALEGIALRTIDWAAKVDRDRAEKIKIWKLAQKYYESEFIETPRGTNENKAFIPLTQIFTDSIIARMHNAGASHGSGVLVSSRAPGDLVEGEVSYEDFSRMMQLVMDHLMLDHVGIDQMVLQMATILGIFGVVYARPHWQKQESLVPTFGAGGRIELKAEPLWSRAQVQILTPDLVYHHPWETDPQTARRIGWRWDATIGDIRRMKAQGRIKKETAEAMERLLGSDPDATRKRGDRAGEESKLNEADMSPTQREFFAMRNLQPKGMPAIRMLRVYERVDLMGRGLDQEVEYDLAMDLRKVLGVRHSSLMHRRRDLVRISMWNDRGVPQSMHGLQTGSNVLVRDVLRNNRLQNGRVLLVGINSPIKANEVVEGGLNIYAVEDPQTHVNSIPLVTGSVASGSMELLAFFQTLIELATGVVGHNLGIEAKSRTAPGVLSTLVEQGGMRLNSSIESMRHGLQEIMWQTMQLAFQNADPLSLLEAVAIEPEDRERFPIAWSAIKVSQVRRAISLEVRVASSEDNKGMRVQRAQATFAQLGEHYKSVLDLAQRFGRAAVDPAMQQMILRMANGLHRSMQKILDAQGEKDQAEMLPDFAEMMGGITSVDVDSSGGGGGSQLTERSSPARTAQAVAGQGAGGLQPATAEGRPVPGGPRGVADFFNRNASGEGTA